ncbi:MAG: transposase, Tn3 family protein [Streptosporangiaceae bacterium]|nr:transposase, Tn3 family protein [Streptosporangiaceae bacterium]
MLWTTRYLDAAVDHLRALPPEEREHDVLDEDVARISPLKHANLNCLGRYSFAARHARACAHCVARRPSTSTRTTRAPANDAALGRVSGRDQ